MGYTHGVNWNEENIKNEIFKVMKALNIDRMPSNQEIILIAKNSRLTNAIRRNGGFYEWANKLGLEIKPSETKFGKEYEEKLANLMVMQGYKVEQMPVRHPYDLLVNDAIKIDVKVSKRYYYDNSNYYYTFNLEKKNATCDLYVCWCINDNWWPDKVLVIPSKDLKITQLTIGCKSEYDKYIDRWDLIKKYDQFYKEIA